MGKKAGWMENVIRSAVRDLGFARGGENPDSSSRSLLGITNNSLGHLYAIFLSTSAEFFDPNPTQLQIACSI